MTNRQLKWMNVGLVAVIATMLFFTMKEWQLRQSLIALTTPAPAAASTMEDEVKSNVAKELIDPRPVWGRIYMYDGGRVVCGFINPRNQFGGFNGMNRFVWSDEGVDVYYPNALLRRLEKRTHRLVPAHPFDDPRNKPIFDDVWERYCKGEPSTDRQHYIEGTHALADGSGKDALGYGLIGLAVVLGSVKLYTGRRLKRLRKKQEFTEEERTAALVRSTSMITYL